MAETDPDGLALVFAPQVGDDRTLTWRELDEGSNRTARAMARSGIRYGDRLAIALKNSPEFILAAFAGWKVGAVVVPVRWDLPEWEKRRVLGVLQPRLVIDNDTGSFLELSTLESPEPLPDVVPPCSRGLCSSGSTGTPKIILIEAPGLVDPKSISITMSIVETWGPQARPQMILVPGPLYHTNSFAATNHLMAGDSIVLMEHFKAERAVDLIEQWRINGFTAATIIFQRIARLPDIERRDLSSLRWTQQGAASLPDWLARKWIELVGPSRFYMSYGMTEGLGLCAIRGDEWLDHPGSVGRPWSGTEVRIVGDDGRVLAPGEVGEIYLRNDRGSAASYLGDVPQLRLTEDRFGSVGDLGWLDHDGYLYIADRRLDLIITGGANVFPAEVEAALSEQPDIADVAVVGVTDPEWGKRVHAVVQPIDLQRPPTKEEIIAFARDRLAAYKVPKTVEIVASLPRTEAGKLNRSLLSATIEQSQHSGSSDA
jgi:bile acid-coenzyme A ligase